MTGAEIVPLRIDCSVALAELHVLCVPASDGWTEPGLKRLLQADAALGCQAEHDGAIIGFILAFAAADEAEVLTLCVAPQHRRQGVGRKLLKELERKLAARHIVHLHLEARVSNLAARELYARVGFGETGRRRRYYPTADGQPAEDAVLMAKDVRGG